MRRTKNISKRIAAAILAAALMMTSTSATVLFNPMVVYAETLPDNNDISGTVDVSEGDRMTNNNGRINENRGIIDNNNTNGSVNENYSQITQNYGSVNDNKAKQSEDVSAGYVRENYGTITTNNGEVGSNRKNNDGSLKGKIETNNGKVASNGTGLTNGADDGNGIRTNNGNVSTNYGYIDDNQGAVNTNDGLINKNEGNDPTTTIYDSYIAKGVHQNNGTITLNTGLVEENRRAGTVTNNNGKVTTNNGTVTNNLRDADLGTGNIVTNNGLVENNHGVIENNVGNEVDTNGFTAVKGVKFNLEDGEITTNSGYVSQNYGTIDINDTTGYVNTNSDGNRTDSHTAIIKVNKGRVNKNSETVTLNTGTINYNEGTVTNNFGNVGCCGEYQDDSGNHPITSYIVNQYDGTLTAVPAQGTERNDTVITNFFGGTINGDGFVVENNFSDQNLTATNQYRCVSFVADDVSTRFSTDYGTGFTDKTLMNSDGTNGATKYYINVTGGNGSGTITIIAADGYEVKQSGQADVTGFDYTLTKQGNNYVLNISGYNGNSIELSPRMFGLVVEAIQQTNPTPAPEPSPQPSPEPSPQPSPEPSPSPSPEPSPSASPEPSPSPSPAPSPVPSPEPSPAPRTELDTNPFNPIGTIVLANTMNKNARVVLAVNEAAIIAEINALSSNGGVVHVPNLAQTGLSASVVAALIAKNDVPINLIYTVGGVKYKLVIPPGFNLLTLLNESGGIDFIKLISVFEASVLEDS